MSKMRDLVTDITADIDEGLLSFEQIAVKHEVSLREVDMLAMEIAEQDTFYHDELQRDWDEAYEPEYPDPDAEYESRYELEDF